MRRLTVFAAIILLVYWLALFVATHIPDLPNQTGLPYGDKLIHTVAYAVLAYVQQQAVDVQGWLTAGQAATGLGLAESTPGPLVIVLQFVGFMAGWNTPGGWSPPAAATFTALLAAYATFLPSFVFILAGAPYVARLERLPRLLRCITCRPKPPPLLVAKQNWTPFARCCWGRKSAAYSRS